MEPFAAAQTIDEVLDRLDTIIERVRRADSRAGYFAVLYRNVTARPSATGSAQAASSGSFCVSSASASAARPPK